MKFVRVSIGNFQELQTYCLSLGHFTAIEASMTMGLITAIEASMAILPTNSWIRILVRPIKMGIIIFEFFSYPSFHLDLFSELCIVQVDLSHLWNTPNVHTLPKEYGSGVYYKVDYDVVMLFGGTEIEAQLCWKENVRFGLGNLLIVLGLTMLIAFYIFRVVRRGRFFSFFLICSLIDILISLVGFMQEPR